MNQAWKYLMADEAKAEMSPVSNGTVMEVPCSR